MQSPGLYGAFFIAFILVYLFFSFYDVIIILINRVMRFAPCAGLLCNSFLAMEDARGSFVAIFFGVKI